jgi:hypothetical protein
MSRRISWNICRGARAALTEVIEDQMALAVDRLRRSGASSASSPSRSMAYP